MNFNLGQFSWACNSGVKEIVEIFIDYAKEDTFDPNYYRQSDYYEDGIGVSYRLVF